MYLCIYFLSPVEGPERWASKRCGYVHLLSLMRFIYFVRNFFLVWVSEWNAQWIHTFIYFSPFDIHAHTSFIFHMQTHCIGLANISWLPRTVIFFSSLHLLLIRSIFTRPKFRADVMFYVFCWRSSFSRQQFLIRFFFVFFFISVFSYSLTIS